MQINAELREELNVCGRTAGVAEDASSEARKLRVRVDQLTSMHKNLFGRMLRLAVLAVQKQVVLSATLYAGQVLMSKSNSSGNNLQPLGN